MRKRTRSPRGSGRKWSEEISRTICGFGRYPEKRPKGLQVDESGAMLLKNLMDAWGRGSGWEENDVMHAVREHMLHDGGPDLRFAIDISNSQDTIIRVLPKRDRNQKRASERSSWQHQGSWNDDRWDRWSDGGTPRGRQDRKWDDRWSQRRGGSWSQRRGGSWSQGSKTTIKAWRGSDAARKSGGSAGSSKSKSTTEKLNSSLDTLIHDKGDDRCSRSASRSPSPWDAHGDGDMDVEEAQATGNRAEHFYIGDEDAGEAKEQGGASKPAPPPGPGWEKFQDTDSDDQLVWWCYAGPPSWWCSDKAKNDIQPYEE